MDKSRARISCGDYTTTFYSSVSIFSFNVFVSKGNRINVGLIKQRCSVFGIRSEWVLFQILKAYFRNFYLSFFFFFFLNAISITWGTSQEIRNRHASRVVSPRYRVSVYHFRFHLTWRVMTFFQIWLPKHTTVTHTHTSGVIWCKITQTPDIHLVWFGRFSGSK